MRIAIAQLDYTIGAFESNYAKIAAAARRARNEKAELVVFSELATTGYPPRDLLERESFIDHNLRLLGKIAELSDEDLGIIVGFVDRNPDQGGKRLLNGVALCHLGEVVARRHKCLLPTYDVFDEIRHFEPAKSVEPVLFRGIRFGLTICEDAWNDPGFQDRQLYDRNPVEELVTRGAELLINISASPFAIGKPGFRKDLFREAATRHRRYNLCINQVGGHDELVFDGHSLGFDPDGSLVFQAHDFAEDFLVVNLEEDAIRGGSASRPGALREVSRSQVEQAYKALVLGLGDYTAKCGFSRVVLGLSGGIDSALTAALAAEALGPENVIGVAMP
ncbi:MAG: nitrilase-related carbon-nitrogen hydrolase, partial [Planctomycetota bacterium]